MHRKPRRGEPPEWSFRALLALAVAAPVAVLVQGGDWRSALFAGPAVLFSTAIAFEAMLGLAQIAVWADRHRR